MNFEDTVLSFEMKLKQISSLRKAISTGIIAYGYLPVMLTKNCPIKMKSDVKSVKKLYLTVQDVLIKSFVTEIIRKF